MNKKLLFAAMSLAALTACSTDDFESQQQVAEGVSPIQFEVINNDGDITRASMEGNKVVWKASDGDLFTLYHGAIAPTGTDAAAATGSFSNAIYTAQAGEEGSPATLSTPSMINKGAAIMVWPVDTTSFSVEGANLSVKILANQTKDIENHIPYVSDLVGIAEYNPKAPYNTAGYNRSYPVFMRPMASQLIIKADYAGTENVLAPLSTGDDAIEPIKVTSVALQSTSKPFTTEIALTFKKKSDGDKDRWNAAVKNNAWTHVTGFGTATHSEGTLTTKCLTGNESSKFLILPQADVAFSDEDAAVVVNTIYGKVSVSKATYGEDYAKAWYRYVSASTDVSTTGEEKAAAAEASGENAGKFKATAGVHTGLKQTIKGFSEYKATKGVAQTEPVGASATRYVKVNLNKLNMDGLHVTTDKQLRDVVRVWQLLGTENVKVFLDGDAKKEFAISQKTIAKINEINAALAEEGRKFTVAPCNVDGEKCETIVFTGGGTIAQDLTFIVANGETVPVALNKGENWKWNSKNVTVDKTATGIKSIINRGTFTSDATATLKIMNNTPAQVSTIGFENALGATWNITAGDINVQFNVTNNGTVNISKGAEYHQDKAGTEVTTFTNDAQSVPERFYKNVADPEVTDKMKKDFVEEIGVVNNSGVFAALSERGQIYNYGLIEHADKDAKTYITKNQTDAVNFAEAFDKASKKMGRINLPIENKDELDVSIKAEGTTGFVSVTVASTADLKDPADAEGKKYVLKGGALDLSRLGTYVNYCIIKKGVKEITAVSEQIKYIEFDDEDDTEIAWNLAGGTVAAKKTASYDGLMILSPVNINLTTAITVSKATFLAAKLYVGGTFTNAGYAGYFGKTAKNAETMYITY